MRTYYHGRLMPLDDEAPTSGPMGFDHHFPQLYDMSADVAQNYSVAERHPDVVREMERRIAQARTTFAPFKRGDPYRRSLAPDAPARKQD